ncbi:MAG: PEP-CTERM sorting domain-containing protein [Chthonomonas sp.]|nr:PEP-CTERM sorting domain-containing protein [Chthonomonas sp.]
MRTTLLFAALAIGAQVHASFDLMYLPSISTSKVLRYDPVNRVSLGGFVAPGAASVYYGGGQNGAVRLSSGPYAYNMYSGTNLGFLGSYPNGVANNGQPFIMSGSTLYDMNLPTGTLTGGVSLTVTGSVLSAQRLSGGKIALFTFNSGAINLAVYNSGGGLLSTTTNILTGATLTSYSSAISIINRNGQDVVAFSLKNSASAFHSLIRGTINPSGVVATTSSVNLSQFSANYAVGLAPAHAGYYVIGADGTVNTTGRFIAYDNDGAGFSYDNWTEAGLDLRNAQTSNYSVGMVLAPEPGEWLAMSMGVGALLLRRRRKLN